MGNRAVYTSEYLDDGHLSIPKEIVNRLTLKSGGKVRVIVETSKFNKANFLRLFGIWNQKNTDYINIFKGVYEERSKFGRGEINL